MRIFHPESVTVLRPVPVTLPAFGDRPDPTSTEITGCGVFPAPLNTEQRSFDQDIANVDITIVVPPGTDVLATDAVMVRGQRYDVLSPPVEIRSPFTGVDEGIRVPLRLSTG